VQARFRKVHRFGVRELAHLEGLHAVEEGSRRVGAVGVVVREETGLARRVPLLAARHAGMAADAHVEVDDQGELLGHSPISLPAT
jgi:hypothetical protein